MKIVIINGNSKPENRPFEDYLKALAANLESKGETVLSFTIRDMSFKPCVGCFSCWLKTPGRCALKDDGPKILSAYVNSDVVVFCSPVCMGFISYLLKRMIDRNLPLAHPYIIFRDGTLAHVRRYDRYPKIGLILDTDSGEMDFINDVFNHLRTEKMLFTRFMDTPVETVAKEILST